MNTDTANECSLTERDSLFNRAIKLAKTGRPEETREAYNNLLHHYPRDAAGWRMYGTWLKAAKDFPAAIEAFRRSLAITDDIPTRNALAMSLAVAGETDMALVEGLRCLEAKDALALQEFRHRFPHPPVLTPVRRRFDPRVSQRNVIAFSLWGDNPTYVHGAIVNARLSQNLYYGWTTRFYCAPDVPTDALAILRKTGAQVLVIDDPRLMGIRPLWRFLASDDPNVDFFLCRDTDSRLNGQELNAVDAWLRSGKPFHAMRDHVYHMELLLAGLWGGMAGVLPPLMKTILDNPRYGNNRFGDQLFLMEFVWPLVRDHILVHDSYYRFHGAVDFPDAYRLPRPIHVGGAIKSIASWR